ncbi:MAG: acyl carrier protein [Propionibacteriaceae bacterium]
MTRVPGDSIESAVAARIREFICTAYLFGDESQMPADTASLLENRVLDSTGVLELIEFLEENYQITVAENETLPENLGSVANLTRFVVAKITRAEGAA